ncbi:MAG: aminotransferase class V-fold PLP-dependent enzyme [Acidobacteria bacterium]|nr:aminotransferase class V-fold PLP-dependent enzyme [Acidobacteriota bacterium]
MDKPKLSRGRLLASAGKGLGLMAILSPSITSLYKNVKDAGLGVDHLSPLEAATHEEYWAEISKAFTISRSNINLNSGWTSPSPKMVSEAYVRYKHQEDATSSTMWQLLEPQAETIRAGLANLFGCDADEIAITRNASESLQILLLGLDIRSGDEVIATSQDYPRMLTALRQREMREGPRLKLVKIPLAPFSTDEIVGAIESAITPQTRLILISHMINITGQIMPVRKICDMARSRGIETVVDGAHSFAQLDFKRGDLQCDYFGSSLHKWLYTPKGAGLLYVKKDKIPNVWPLMASEDRLKSDIRKFEEIGTHSSATRLAIGEALLFHEAIGPKRKEERLRHLSSYWMSRLKTLPRVTFNTSFDPEQFCAIANFSIEGGDVTKITKYLMARHKIIATPIVHDEFSGIRVTPNIFTKIGELDRFCKVIEKMTQKALPKELRS